MARTLIQKWEESNDNERKEFLFELHRRYNFGRLCTALFGRENCWFYQKILSRIKDGKNLSGK